MKKVIVPLVGLSALLVGCGGVQFQTNEEYEFSHVEFYCADYIDIEDLSAFVPMGMSAQVSSVKDLENLIKKNLDTYSIQKHTENGTERIYLKNEIESVEFGNFYKAEIEIGGRELVGEYYGTGDAYTVSWEGGSQTFYFRDKKMYYSIEFIEGFEIRYMYQD